MHIDLPPNFLHKYPQTFDLDKVAILIGENGSGKSCILQSIFEGNLNGNILSEKSVICFSSEQNENFSKIYRSYTENNNNNNKNAISSTKSFYFEKSWSKFLIFFAALSKTDGLVRKFLENNKSINTTSMKEFEDNINISFPFEVNDVFINRLRIEKKLDPNTIINSQFISFFLTLLKNFIKVKIDKNFDFENPIEKRQVTLKLNDLIQFGNESLDNNGYKISDIDNFYLRQKNMKFFTIIVFLIQAAYENNVLFECQFNFINREHCKLFFRDNFDFDQLSEGEYQLLSIFSLIDIFDSDFTLFIFDEVDSHLHHFNIEKLWTVLHGIEGDIITTTHHLESITAKENSIHNLFAVEKGQIKKGSNLKHLIKRFENISRFKNFENRLYAKLRYIVVMDDYNDWSIFKMLAKRKGCDIEKLEKIKAIKITSNYKNINDFFGLGKFNWLSEFKNIDVDIQTKEIFLICDKDKAILEWKSDNVQVAGDIFKEKINQLKLSQKSINAYLLAWKRLEIKNYLLSYTALKLSGLIPQENERLKSSKNTNGNEICKILEEGHSGDKIDIICDSDAKELVNSLINDDQEGLDLDKLESYINLIPPCEISEDIENMYNFIVKKIENDSKKNC